MAKLKAEHFKEDIKDCFNKCKIAVKEVIDTYKENSEEFKAMSLAEQESFCAEAFVIAYDEFDKHFKLAPVVDSVAKYVVIPEAVGYVFRGDKK